MEGRASPLLSLVIPYTEGPDSLCILLEAILHQSFKGPELVVVDDASETPPDDIVRAFRNKGLNNIRLERRQSAGGLKEACLSGIESASGVIVGFLDGTVRLHESTALERYTDLFLDTGADVLECGARRAVRDGMLSDEALEGRDIFAWHACQANEESLLWTSLFSRQLCMKRLDVCRTSRVRHGRSDFFLASWFMFHASRYHGGKTPGWSRREAPAPAKAHMAAGCLVDGMFILEEFIPYLLRNECPQADVERFCRRTVRLMADDYGQSLAQGPYPPDLPMTGDAYAKFRGHVDHLSLARALHYLLFLTRRAAERHAGSTEEKMRE